MNLIALKGGDTMNSNIKKSTVVNGCILVHTGSTLLNGIEIKQSGWVVSPNRKIENGFSDHRQYWNSLKALGFKKEPKLHDMKIISSYYEDHGTMGWNEVRFLNGQY